MRESGSVRASIPNETDQALSLITNVGAIIRRTGDRFRQRQSDKLGYPITKKSTERSLGLFFTSCKGGVLILKLLVSFGLQACFEGLICHRHNC